MPLVSYLKVITKFKVIEIFLLLFSRSFVVLHFILGCVVHFDLIFVKGIKSVSRIFFFACIIDVHLSSMGILDTVLCNSLHIKKWSTPL